MMNPKVVGSPPSTRLDAPVVLPQPTLASGLFKENYSNL